MIWTLLLHLLWKGAITGEALTYDPILNQIFAPLPPNAGSDFLTCLASPVNVDFGFVKVGDIIYKRKTLCGEEAESAKIGAVQLTARGLFACAKEAAAQALSSFYVDDQGRCLGSNIVVQDEGGTCFFNKLVIYSSDTQQLSCNDNPPTVNDFTIVYSDAETSYKVNFDSPCLSCCTFEMRSGARDYGAVRPGDAVPSDGTECRYIAFYLTPFSSGGEAGETVAYETAPSPDVRNFVVGDFGADLKSLVVTFEPVCPGSFLYELVINGILLGLGYESGKRVELDSNLTPCSETPGIALQAKQDFGDYYGESLLLILAPPVTTPGDCARFDETEKDFEN